jgi:hypothetical protein
VLQVHLQQVIVCTGDGREGVGVMQAQEIDRTSVASSCKCKPARNGLELVS